MSLGEYLGAGSGTTKLLLHLNGNSTDSSGNGNNGTDTAITYSQANGKFGQGAGFNGSSSKIVLASSASLNPTLLTFGAWIKVSSNGGIIGGNGGGLGTFALKITVSDGHLTCDSSGVANVASSSGYGALDSSTWYHCMMTYNKTTGAYNFYINAKNIGSGINIVTLNTGALSIGSNNTGEFLTGAIDEVIMESVIWTPQQVQKYYTFSKGRFGI